MIEDDQQHSSFWDNSSDDEADWEEVAVPTAPDMQPEPDDVPYDPYGPSVGTLQPSDAENIEITIQTRPKAEEGMKKKGLSHTERMLRIDVHKAHTVALLANACVRNKWLNDQLLHARLMSLTPLSIHNAFAMIHKSRVPDAAKRGRLFEAAMTRLVEWWGDYFEVLPEGHLRSRTYDDVAAEIIKVEERVRAKAEAARRKKGKGKQRARQNEDTDKDDDEAELIRSEKSLMKHVLQRDGSRDVSAQLFTALCRALGIPARLVVSLQSMPWRASEGKPKAPTKKKAKGQDVAVNGEGESRTDEADIPPATVDAKGKKKAVFPGEGRRMDGKSTSSPLPSPGPSHINLRKQKPKGQTLASSVPLPTQTLRPPDPLTTPPVFWTEVFSRPDGRWIPVDPIRCLVNKRKLFDPSPSSGSTQPKTRVDNRLVYVVAFEEDGYGRDVTPRYAREYGAKVAKTQGAERASGKGRRAWWESVTAMVTRPYRLQRDDVEDDDLHVSQITEAMPTTMAGFKDHPLYALARHVKRDEVIHPLTELGKFRGEPVYPRANVIALKAADNWMRSGRIVKEGAQPMKWVKMRASTVNKRRELEVAGEALGEGEVLQGLYALNQTELYRPPPVLDGKIPKNDFGNIDLYVPSMLPDGAAHVPYKGTAKIARKLGFDFAEAVTGFEFRKRKANAVITGIVIAIENEPALLEAYWEAEQDVAEREAAKKRERALKRWTRLVQGLRIRKRLTAQYAGTLPTGKTITVDVATRATDGANSGAGFMMAEDEVVQPFALPRLQYEQEHTANTAGTNNEEGAATDGSDTGAKAFNHLSLEIIGDDEDADAMDMEEVLPVSVDVTDGVPKTMAQLAEAAVRNSSKVAREQSVENEDDADMEEYVPDANTKSNGTTSMKTNEKGRILRSTPTKAVPNDPHQTRSQAPRRASRKRAREPDAEDEDDPSAPVSDGSELSDEPSTPATPAPRASRVKKGAAPAPAPTPPSAGGRTLRARRTKTADQLAEERQREAAYRRAVAQ